MVTQATQAQQPIDQINQAAQQGAFGGANDGFQGTANTLTQAGQSEQAFSDLILKFQAESAQRRVKETAVQAVIGTLIRGTNNISRQSFT